MVTLDSADNIFIGGQKVNSAELDSVLTAEIIRVKKNITDTVSVVIDADAASSYGLVFAVMKVVKKQAAKLISIVK